MRCLRKHQQKVKQFELQLMEKLEVLAKQVKHHNQEPPEVIDTVLDHQVSLNAKTHHVPMTFLERDGSVVVKRA